MKLDAEVAETLQPWFPSIDLDKIHIVTTGPVCSVVRNGLRQGAMTLSPFIFFGRDEYDPTSRSSVALVAHELKHVEQYHRYGHIMFLARYFWDLGRNKFRYSRSLPLEAECYELQARVRGELPERFV